MATLDTLKKSLWREAATVSSSARLPLSDAQYSARFEFFRQGARWKTYRDFITPQLSQLLDHLIDARPRISVLEIGPGPESVLGHLPEKQRRKISRYAAFEPKELFASNLEAWLAGTNKKQSPLPGLADSPKIHRLCFHAGGMTEIYNDKYDLILFCHSMYGMKPKRPFIERALRMLVEQSVGGMVVVFHREGMHCGGLVCHRIASFPTGAVSVLNNELSVPVFHPTREGTVFLYNK